MTFDKRLEFAENSLLSAKTDLEEALKCKENSFNFAIELAKSIGLPKQVDRQSATPKPNQETRSNGKEEYLKAKQNRQNQLNQLTKNNDSVSLLIGILLVSISVFGIVFRPVLPVSVMDNLFFAACILTILWLISHFNKNRNLNNNQSVK